MVIEAAPMVQATGDGMHTLQQSSIDQPSVLARAGLRPISARRSDVQIVALRQSMQPPQIIFPEYGMPDGVESAEVAALRGQVQQLSTEVHHQQAALVGQRQYFEHAARRFESEARDVVQVEEAQALTRLTFVEGARANQAIQQNRIEAERAVAATEQQLQLQAHQQVAQASAQMQSQVHNVEDQATRIVEQQVSAARAGAVQAETEEKARLLAQA